MKCIYCGITTDDGSDEHETCFVLSAECAETFGPRWRAERLARLQGRTFAARKRDEFPDSAALERESDPRGKCE